MTYTADTLRFAASDAAAAGGLVNRITPASAGWSHLGVELRRLDRGAGFAGDTGGQEAALVVLGGVVAVRSSRGEWPRVGRRADVFAGMPWALYLPRATRFEVTAMSGPVELAIATAATDRDHPPRLVTPDDVEIEIRGGGSNTRQINPILPPGFACHRLVAVEVYTPSGNWSSYPPHKHDAHRVGPDGALIEADLEEVYLYKMRQPGGHALQRIYSPEHALDATVVARDGDIVLVPYGYHPVSAAFGYDCYYLNFLAGSAQSLASVDDPEHAWVRERWVDTDPRVPLVDHALEAGAAAAR